MKVHSKEVERESRQKRVYTVKELRIPLEVDHEGLLR